MNRRNKAKKKRKKRETQTRKRLYISDSIMQRIYKCFIMALDTYMYDATKEHSDFH